MEPVSDEEKVGVDEPHRLRDVLFKSGAWVEAKLDPALVSLMSNVVLQWSSDLALACKGTVHESIQQRRFKSRHYFLAKFIITDQSFNLARSLAQNNYLDEWYTTPPSY